MIMSLVKLSRSTASLLIISYSDLLRNYNMFKQSFTFGHLVYSYIAIKNNVPKSLLKKDKMLVQCPIKCFSIQGRVRVR